MGLGEQAAFLRSVLESSTEYSIVAKDLEGRILAWYEGARRVYGYEAAEITGQSANVLHDPDDVQSGRVREILAEARRTGRWSGALTRVRKDGSTFRAQVTITLRRDQKGKPIGFTMISLDLTGSDKIERQLAQRMREDVTLRERAESRFRAAVESAPNGMVMIDPAGAIVLGYTRAELMGKRIDDLVPERFRGRHPGFRAEFFARPGIRAMGAGRELFGLRKDGTEIPVEIGLNPIEEGEGKFVLASVVDITARKQADARFRAAVESAPNGMVMIDRSGKIILVNREIERLFGYTREELLGQPIERLVPQRLRERHPGRETAPPELTLLGCQLRPRL